MVVRNTTGDPCMRAAVGRYIIVVRYLVGAASAEPRWTFEGPDKPCPVNPFCGISSFCDADLQPLPDPGDVSRYDALMDLWTAPKKQDPVYRYQQQLGRLGRRSR